MPQPLFARSRLVLVLMLVAALLTSEALQGVAQPQSADLGLPAERLVSYSEARPALEGLRNDLLPADLRAKTPGEIESLWPAWVSRRDREVRDRLARGDEDSVLNLLLFGSSFTKLPRVTSRELEALEGRLSYEELIRERITNLISTLGTADLNERLQFARHVLTRQGIDPGTEAGAALTRRFLLDGLARMADEFSDIDRSRRDAQLSNDPSAQRVEELTRYQRRGLSSDTSILSSFGIDQALKSIAGSGLLGPASVRRVAIIGPGLDFVDKRDGYDIYPLQTIQPFAVQDALIRHRLAMPGDLRVTTLDLSPRINQHLQSAGERARDGRAYTLQLPRDQNRAWTAGLTAYWRQFGEFIGIAVTPIAAPQAGGPDMRAVRIRPEVVTAIEPRDLNIIFQRFNRLADDQRFDLVVATDMFLYYDVFEQSLALANVASMLRPQGLLLSNTGLVELPGIEVSGVGYTDVLYMTLPEVGDRLYTYKREGSPTAPRAIQ